MTVWTPWMANAGARRRGHHAGEARNSGGLAVTNTATMSPAAPPQLTADEVTRLRSRSGSPRLRPGARQSRIVTRRRRSAVRRPRRTSPPPRLGRIQRLHLLAGSPGCEPCPGQVVLARSSGPATATTPVTDESASRSEESQRQRGRGLAVRSPRRSPRCAGCARGGDLGQRPGPHCLGGRDSAGRAEGPPRRRTAQRLQRRVLARPRCRGLRRSRLRPLRRPAGRLPPRGAHRQLVGSQPDVAILDVRLPDGDGVTVCRDIRSAVSPPRPA
jgi:CheY-like chemotaxis protein